MPGATAAAAHGVQRLFWKSTGYCEDEDGDVSPACLKETACGMYQDAAAIAKELHVPVGFLKAQLVKGTGIKESTCPRR